MENAKEAVSCHIKGGATDGKPIPASGVDGPAVTVALPRGAR